MYMYYLLGHRLMELPISVDRKEVRIWKFDAYLINNPRMFNGVLFDLAEEPYIPQKILLQ